MASVEWQQVKQYTDIIYEKADEGIARITINRPKKRNAFRPKTLAELTETFHDAHEDTKIGVILFTGAGNEAFCAGGDQSVRGPGGYVGEDGVPRLNVLELQRYMRLLPKPIIAVVAGYAIGGGNVLQICCDMTIAADNAKFGQAGPKVGSFDGGFGVSLLIDLVGRKKAMEMKMLCRHYSADEALAMGLINTVVPLDRLEEESIQWAREILDKSPSAIRYLKACFNAVTDGYVGLQALAGELTQTLYYNGEAVEGRNAFLEKRKPDFSKFPRVP